MGRHRSTHIVLSSGRRTAVAGARTCADVEHHLVAKVGGVADDGRVVRPGADVVLEHVLLVAQEAVVVEERVVRLAAPLLRLILPRRAILLLGHR